MHLQGVEGIVGCQLGRGCHLSAAVGMLSCRSDGAAVLKVKQVVAWCKVAWQGSSTLKVPLQDTQGGERWLTYAVRCACCVKGSIIPSLYL